MCKGPGSFERGLNGLPRGKVCRLSWQAGGARGARGARGVNECVADQWRTYKYVYTRACSYRTKQRWYQGDANSWMRICAEVKCEVYVSTQDANVDALCRDYGVCVHVKSDHITTRKGEERGGSTITNLRKTFSRPVPSPSLRTRPNTLCSPSCGTLFA